jgi:hypothetical protein
MQSSDGLSPQKRILSGRENHRGDSQDEKKDTENYRNPEECLLDTTPGGENAPCIRSCQNTQTSALALQDNTDYEGN